MTDTLPPPTEVPALDGQVEGQRLLSRIALKGRTLREHTARGTIVNALFLIALNFLGLVKGFAVAAFLTQADYGIWGLLLITLLTVGWLKQVGVGDKYVQQSEDDQEAAFQKAFSVEALFTAVVFAICILAIPLAAWVYGRPELLVPGLVLSLIAPLAIFQAPLWTYYRRMDFVRQRTLQAVDPVVSFVATIALAIAGAGYWSLIAGALLGALVGSIVAVRACPYPLRLRLDRATLRTYTAFSWPLLVASASTLIIAQGSFIVGEHELGIAGVGAMALALAIVNYTDRVDEIVTQTLYPAICAVRDRTDLLFESFVKSNRLALMWGMPFGVGLALFASDLVEFGIGERWRSAIGLIQALGLIAAANHIGFNWHAFYRARGSTRPVAVWVGANLLAWAAAVPLLIRAEGLRGYAYGLAIMLAVSLAVRGYYLTRLFAGFAILKHAARAIAPTIPAAAAVLAVRALDPASRSLWLALGELLLYGVVTVLATWFFERALLREVAGYLRGRPAVQPGTA